ncbi:MAG: sulfatase-like hydrolase/transferase, partial [Planctomycetales bacterium]|nr:sulfatase-like hydrolase/transferase [Planctomycetales bacterium]
YVKDYLRCVDAVDENLGRVLAYLDQSGLADNTVVVYSSDQGWYLGEHGWYDKRWMYEESFRTPLLVRWPGVVRPGSENRDLTSNLD